MCNGFVREGCQIRCLLSPKKDTEKEKEKKTASLKLSTLYYVPVLLSQRGYGNADAEVDQGRRSHCTSISAYTTVFCENKSGKAFKKYPVACSSAYNIRRQDGLVLAFLRSFPLMWESATDDLANRDVVTENAKKKEKKKRTARIFLSLIARIPLFFTMGRIIIVSTSQKLQCKKFLSVTLKFTVESFH